MSKPTLIDRSLVAGILLILAASVAIHLRSPVFFDDVYAVEDGLVETATALFLLICSPILLGAALRLWRKGRHGAAALTAFYGLLFFVAAGEEISWGQRIFGWQTNDFFLQNNKQHETNLHNLVIGGFDVNKILFGATLTIVTLIYLLVLPPLYRRVEWIRRLVDALVIPVPGLRHSVLAIVASLVVAAMDQNRKWEVYELVFSMLMVSIFLLPQNRERIR